MATTPNQQNNTCHMFWCFDNSLHFQILLLQFIRQQLLHILYCNPTERFSVSTRALSSTWHWQTYPTHSLTRNPTIKTSHMFCFESLQNIVHKKSGHNFHINYCNLTERVRVKMTFQLYLNWEPYPTHSLKTRASKTLQPVFCFEALHYKFQILDFPGSPACYSETRNFPFQPVSRRQTNPLPSTRLFCESQNQKSGILTRRFHQPCIRLLEGIWKKDEGLQREHHAMCSFPVTLPLRFQHHVLLVLRFSSKPAFFLTTAATQKHCQVSSSHRHETWTT